MEFDTPWNLIGKGKRGWCLQDYVPVIRRTRTRSEGKSEHTSKKVGLILDFAYFLSTPTITTHAIVIFLVFSEQRR
jgi:hypothetical protein